MSATPCPTAGMSTTSAESPVSSSTRERGGCYKHDFQLPYLNQKQSCFNMEQEKRRVINMYQWF